MVKLDEISKQAKSRLWGPSKIPKDQPHKLYSTVNQFPDN